MSDINSGDGANDPVARSTVQIHPAAALPKAPDRPQHMDDIFGNEDVLKPELYQRRAKRALWAMMIVGIIFSGVAFAYKISEFLFAINSKEARGFADVPVTAYFFVAAGWILVLYWAFNSGQLRNAEVAKYDMLKQEEAYERAGE